MVTGWVHVLLPGDTCACYSCCFLQSKLTTCLPLQISGMYGYTHLCVRTMLLACTSGLA